MISESEQKEARLQVLLNRANLPKGIKGLETNPHHFFDENLLYWSRKFMIDHAEGKLTLGYHFKRLPENIILNGPVLEGDKEAFPIKSRWPLGKTICNIRTGLGGWKKRFIVGVDLRERPEDYESYSDENYIEAIYHKGLRFAFIRQEEQKRRYSSIILYCPFVASLGQDNLQVGLIEGHSFNPIPTEVFEYRTELSYLPFL